METTCISHRSNVCKLYNDLHVSGFVFNCLKLKTVEKIANKCYLQKDERNSVRITFLPNELRDNAI